MRADTSHLPRKRYGLIAADPPWKFKAGKSSRSTENHYPTMSLDEIKAMPVWELAADDCALLLWTTPPFIEQSLAVMKAWKFRFVSTGFVWLKLKPRHGDPGFFMEPDLFVSLGHTTRKCSEFCLLGKRGRPKRLARNVRELLIAPRREHSRKPELFYTEAARLYPGPCIELFSRTRRDGWEVFGNETTKFSSTESPEV